MGVAALCAALALGAGQAQGWEYVGGGLELSTTLKGKAQGLVYAGWGGMEVGYVCCGTVGHGRPTEDMARYEHLYAARVVREGGWFWLAGVHAGEARSRRGPGRRGGLGVDAA